MSRDFFVGDVGNPAPPPQPFSDSLSRFEHNGEMFELTKNHDLLDPRGKSSIKVGSVVPENGVNLAFYENKVSTFKDMISIEQTDTNNVEVEYVEVWIKIHKTESNNEDMFAQYIDFRPDKDHRLKDYHGVLKRDFVSIEQIDNDYRPTFYREVYEEYRGLTQSDLDGFKLTRKYDDEGLYGTLRLSHTITEAIDFYRRESNIAHPKKYAMYAKFEGRTMLTDVIYNASARYSGLVTKKDSLINVDPDKHYDKVMFPSDSKVLLDESGVCELLGDDFLVTKVFKDGEPLFYKHRLKLKYYNAVVHTEEFEAQEVRIVFANGTPLNINSHKYLALAYPTSTRNIYDLFVYTSFIPSIPLYVTYDGIEEKDTLGTFINPMDIKIGVKEKISVHYAVGKDDFVIEKSNSKSSHSILKVDRFDTITDNRASIEVGFQVILDETYASKTYTAKVMNSDYSIASDSDIFINKEQIVSERAFSGYLTAKEMFVLDNELNAQYIKSRSNFRIRFDNSYKNTMFDKDLIHMYTDTSGDGLVMATTFEDTNNNTPVGRLKKYHMYQSLGDGLIRSGYGVRSKNSNRIYLKEPVSSSSLMKWHIAIDYAYFTKTYHREDKSLQIVYSMPEYHNQFYKDKYPLIKVENEVVQILDTKTIKLKRDNLFIEHKNDTWTPSNIIIKKDVGNGTQIELRVESYSAVDGIIELTEHISYQDTIYATYQYEEKLYHYKGYFLNQDTSKLLIDLNFNPSQYQSFTDNSNKYLKREPVYSLFNKEVYIFLRPYRIIDLLDDETVLSNDHTVYHTIGTPEKSGPFDLLLGKVTLRHYSSLDSLNIIDSRSRGGGVLETISDNLRRQLEPESDMYLDIGTLDGTPYHENSVVVIKIDERVLEANGGRFTKNDVEVAVNKWGAYGMFPIIEYVKSPNSFENINNSIEVSSTISSMSMYKPYVTSAIYEI